MFKHYVFDSEVTFLGESELIGLSPKRLYLLKVYQHCLHRMDSLSEYKIACLIKATIHVSILNQVLNILFLC